jgi:CBS domain-containing protein
MTYRVLTTVVLMLGGCAAIHAPSATERPHYPGDTLPADGAAPLAWSSGRDAESAPFSSVQPPDHVITMTSDESGREVRTTIRRHGDWASVERASSAAPVVPVDGKTLVGFAAPVTVSFTRDRDGRYRAISIRMNATPYRTDAPYLPSERTGEEDTLLGEHCAVWNITPRVSSGPSYGRWFSCVTDDGIELWRRYVGASSYRYEMRAISLSREPVAAAEVKPPADLLDTARWPEGLLGRVSDPSVEVLLGTDTISAPDRRDKHYRRLGPIERTDEPMLTMVANRATGAVARLDRDRDGRFIRLTVTAARDGELGKEDIWGKPEVRDEPGLTYGGETCTWFDMTPNVADYNLSACRTEDEVSLAERVYGRANRFSQTALFLSRAPLRPSAVAMPASALVPAHWGLPDRRR